MSESNDPRVAELLRRRAGMNGATAAPAPRKLEEADRAIVRAIAAAHPTWKPSEIADDFEADHGWRPSVQGIGRTLAETPAPPSAGDEPEVEAGPGPAPRKAPARRPAAAGQADPEVGAMSMIAMALGGLAPAEVRRVLAWARARFGEGGDS